MAKAKIEERKLTDFRAQDENANAHTERGLQALGDAYGEVGYVAPMTAAANGEMLDGSARLEKAVEQFPDEALVVRHDGSKPIVMIREDIKDANDPKGKRISYGANRIGEIDLAWDPEQILADLDAGVDLSGLFNEGEIEIIGGIEVDDPLAEWQGMPEFENNPIAYRTLYIHFRSSKDIEEFLELIGQEITEKTKTIWIPEREKSEKMIFIDEK